MIKKDIKSREEIASVTLNKKITFTSGTFDILHYGHIEFLEKASKLSDCLVVGINSDNSVKKYKGKDRPINEEKERAEIVLSIGYVDYVFLFDEENNNRNVEILKPSFYAKGSEYFHQLSSASIVEAYGGTICLIPMLPKRSTTSLINKIIKVHGKNSL